MRDWRTDSVGGRTIPVARVCRECTRATTCGRTRGLWSAPGGADHKPTPLRYPRACFVRCASAPAVVVCRAGMSPPQAAHARRPLPFLRWAGAPRSQGDPGLATCSCHGRCCRAGSPMLLCQVVKVLRYEARDPAGRCCRARIRPERIRAGRSCRAGMSPPQAAHARRLLPFLRWAGATLPPSQAPNSEWMASGDDRGGTTSQET